MPSLAVTRFSFVMTSSIFCVMSVSNFTSLLVIIPKSFLYRTPGDDYATEKDMVLKEDLKNMVVRKEILVKSRKLS